MPINDENRRKRMADLGVKHVIATPESDAKMSEVIVQLAEPLIKRHGKTAQRIETIIMLTIAAWNKAMLPQVKQPNIEKELVDALVSRDANAETVAVVLEIFDLVEERRRKLFPDLRKIVVDYEMNFRRGHVDLNVTSAPIPDRSKEGQE
jgi:hypothetical protein